VTASPRFVLVTLARDEAVGIAETILSVIGQYLPPLRWVIVDDGSIDGMAALVSRCIAGVKWITLVSRDSAAQPADFASKVHAVPLVSRSLTARIMTSSACSTPTSLWRRTNSRDCFKHSMSAAASALRADT
jgi:glycosyltransferase involved in cell wall biosynthesis